MYFGMLNVIRMSVAPKLGTRLTDVLTAHHGYRISWKFVGGDCPTHAERLEETQHLPGAPPFEENTTCALRLGPN